jgi:microcystin-dependent protein
MPDATTPVLGLTQPEVGASRDSWGAKWNNNASILDQYVSQAMPIGGLLDFAGGTPPSGWLACDGRAISRVTYSDLFAVVGVVFGAGDGSTTFALPDFRGRSGVGVGTVTDQGGLTFGFGFGTKWGFVYQTVAQSNLPAYNLVTDYQGSHSHGGASVAAGGHSHTTDAQGNHSHGGATAGENALHYHTGTTDLQGDHQHSYSAWFQQAGNFIAGGGGTQGAMNSGLTSVNGAHQHNFQTSTESNAHAHAIPLDGLHAHTTTFIGDHQHGITADGYHGHNVNLGGGGVPMLVLSPVLTITKIIYCGNQASTRAVLDAAPAPASFADPGDEMAAIREELAALKALLMPATRRVMSSPSRGPH